MTSRTSDITHKHLSTWIVCCVRIRQHGGLSEISNAGCKDGKQQVNNLWPGRFVKDKIYEETSTEYSTIMLMLVK